MKRIFKPVLALLAFLLVALFLFELCRLFVTLVGVNAFLMIFFALAVLAAVGVGLIAIVTD